MDVSAPRAFKVYFPFWNLLKTVGIVYMRKANDIQGQTQGQLRFLLPGEREDRGRIMKDHALPVRQAGRGFGALQIQAITTNVTHITSLCEAWDLQIACITL